VAWDPRRAVVKVHPLATWTQDQVDAYIAEHNVLVNPLVSEGYPSLGCAPCTARPEPGADPRSGRWAGREKTECGIHV
jgi:phosphoadenosine phosphosulfate reductase